MDTKIIEQIQKDIVNPEVPLSNILFKAKVLAYQLDNDGFKRWVKCELNGYDNQNEVPDYRIIPVQSKGYFANQFQSAENIPIPLIALPERLQEAASKVWLFGGVRSLEELANSEQGAQFDWPAKWTMILNSQNRESLPCLQATRRVSAHVFAQILDVIRSKLQDFILEISDLPWDMEGASVPSEQIQRLVNVTIYNDPQGGKVSVFDQRHQEVSHQYNAAGNINFDAVQSTADLMLQLKKLQDELSEAIKAGVFDEDTATDAEYQVKKAVQQAKKPEPNKKAIVKHLERAKSLIDGVASAAGLVTALAKAADMVQKLF